MGSTLDRPTLSEPRFTVALFLVAPAACAAGCGQVATRAASDASASIEGGAPASDLLDGPKSDDASTTGADVGADVAADAGADVATAAPVDARLFDASCDAADFGLACGPAERPCRLVIDEFVDAGSQANPAQVPTGPVGASLALASDHTDVLLDSPLGNVHASRGADGAWKLEPAPGRGTGTIVLTPDGALRIVGDGPDPPTSTVGFPSGLTIWTRTGGGWSQTDLLANDLGAAPYAAAVDGLGRIHAVVEDSSSLGALAYARWESAFAVQDIPSGYGGTRPVIAVSTAGNPQVAFWGTPPQASSWTVLWATTDGSQAEALATLGGNLYGHEGPFALAIGGGALEQPHLLFVRRRAPGTRQQAFEVDYAFRDPSAGWSIQPLAAGDATEFPTGAPQDGGRTSTFRTYRPVSVVIDDAGAVRLLYVEYSMTITPSQPSMDQPVDIDPQAPWGATVNDARLHVAWACGGAIAGDSVLPVALHPAALDAFSPAVVGPEGAIHLALVEETAPALVGRYLVLGP